MRLLRACVLVGVMAGLAGVAGAQTGIYGEFTGAKLNAANAPWMYGPTVGFYHDAGYGLLAAGFDVRGTFAGRGRTNGASDQTLATVMGGVRLAVTPHVLPIKPYGEVLGGLGHLKTGQGATATKFAYQFVGGVDWTMVPRVDWRVVEFSYGRLAGLGDSFAPKTLSTGIVFRLP